MAAISETGATLGFDAIGGGPLAGQILAAMEAALVAKTPPTGPYGSPVHKQVYVYGRLDPSPPALVANVGMAWGVGGWLLFHFLQRIGAEEAQKLRQRVASEITTTFASHYTREITLAQALEPEIIRAYYRRATGEKFLIVPSGRTDRCLDRRCTCRWIAWMRRRARLPRKRASPTCTKRWERPRIAWRRWIHGCGLSSRACASPDRR